MPLDISFDQFNRIASGTHNAGQIDYKGSDDNVTLKKVNAHVHYQSLNTATIDAKRVVDIKQAFVRAMESKLGSDKGAIAEIRKSLGLPPDDSNPRALSARAIEPLTRQEVRQIIDRYVNRADGANARQDDAEIAARRDAVNVQNRRALPIRIGDQSFRLDKMAAELEKKTVAEPAKSQAAEILKTLTRPDGKIDIPALARSLNVFAFMAERSAAADKTEGAPDAEKRFAAAFAQALDSLDNGTLSQVYQGLISRDADGLKNELSRRLAKFDLTAEQTGVCCRMAFALGHLEALVLGEISHRIALGKAETPEARQALMAQAPVFRHCGNDVQRDLSKRGGADEMTSVNLEILTNRAAYGSIHGGELTGKADKEMRDAGFTEADAHDIGDMIRKSELTVNAHLSNLLGWRKGQDPKNPPLFQPGYSLVNTFVSKEQKNIAKDANSYLVRRNQIEKHFFPEYGSMPQFEGRDRPNYAAFNLANGVQGAAPNYGGVVFVMKEHVKQQATYTLSDTFFAIKFDFTKPEECKARFLESAGKYLSKFVKPEVVAQLADPSTAAGAALEYFFRLYAASGVITGKGLETDNRLVQIEDSLNANRIEGARKIDKDDLMAVLFDAIGVKEDGASRVAGYDNIENLLVGMEELDPVLMGLSTVRRAANPGESIQVAGGEYIEAQLHGPIVVSRDVAEMRVDVGEIDEHYRNLADDDPSVTGGMDKDKWIAAQIAADREKLLRFGKDNGFKVTFWEKPDGHAIDVAKANLVSDTRTVKRMMQEKNEAYFHDLLDNHSNELFDMAFKGLSNSSIVLARSLFGEGLANAPEWLGDVLRAAAGRSLEMIDNLETDDNYRKSDIRESVVSNMSEALGQILDAVSAGRKLGETDDRRLLALIGEGLDSGMKAHNVMNFVAAKIVRERIAADPQALIRETLEKELADRKDEIAALGLPGGFVPGGAALKRILGKIEEHLAKFASKGGAAASLTNCRKLVDEIRRKVIAPEISSRLDHLKAVAGKPFPDEALKDSYYGWALNAGKIKSGEEATGVKAGAETLYASLSALLTAKRDFGAPAFTAALQNVVRIIDEVCEADAAANYQGEDARLGPDDRNGYVSRAVSVGLAAIEAKMGRQALEKLARILSSPAVTDLRQAMGSVSDAEGNPLTTCATIGFAIAERLQNKYGFASMPLKLPIIPYSQFPPNIRSLLSAIDPETIAALDAKTPYAPQTTKTMPPALDPTAAPTTLAQRRKALMGALPAYGMHEKTFEDGRNIHGRGHATRVFVFANVLGNIMRERGVSVDMGSLSISAAGHDMGRKGSGTDHWEKESGQLVTNLAEEIYPGAYGDEWKTQTNLNVSAGHGASADAQRTIEGLLMKAADSLDYTRVAPLEANRFHFLEKTLSVGGVHVMQDDALRKALMHEAELLTKATSPLAANREKIIRLKESDDKQKVLQGEALDADVTEAERKLAQLSDQEVVDRIEAEIRDNPTKYPLLNKYYFYDQE